MLCDKCGKKSATVHIKQVINGKQTEQHLCTDCADGAADLQMPGFGSLDLQKLFWGTPAADVRRPKICPGCGISWAEAAKGGRLGCARCYAAFADELRPQVAQMHGGKRHIGKVKMLNPTAQVLLQDSALANKNYERLALQKQLGELVDLEKFEEAAAVRDKIRSLEAELQQAVQQANAADQKAGDER